MSRFFTQQIEGNTARITGEDVRHLSRVLRLRVGDAVEICDGACTDYTGRIEAITEQEVRCALSGAHPSPTEPRCRVTLFQALPKTGKLELIVQKCVELGVDTVVGFTGSPIWHMLYAFPPISQDDVQAGFDEFARRFRPILDAYQKMGIRFALEAHPTEIAFDIASAKRALEAGITAVTFDRGGRIYHGRVKALADGARAAGLQF